MAQRYFSYKNSQVSYYRLGSGPQPVLCFHGYGEQGSAFEFLEKYAGNQYSFFAIDLPFHGKTGWNEGLNFSVNDLQAILAGILEQELDHPFHAKLILLGFSLGGRIALSLCQCWPGRVEKMILLAPDGLRVNAWYWLATQTAIGNRLFRLTMKKPDWFMGLLNRANKWGWVNSSIFKFVHHYIGDPEVRQLLYLRWTALRKLRPGLPRIKKYTRQYGIRIRLVYGQHDRIILPVRGENFIKGIEEFASLAIISSGHQVLHEKHAKEIIAALSH